MTAVNIITKTSVPPSIPMIKAEESFPLSFGSANE